MPGSQHGPSIKRPDIYDALRRRGYSKSRAAAISNAIAKRGKQGTKAMRPRRKALYWNTYRTQKGQGASPAECRKAAIRALRNQDATTARTAYDRARFAVYKAADGTPRWAAVSSTAYRDRDGEIVSSDALRQAVALADGTGQRGPLRFWHVPGLDIGTCDFQALAVNDRFLIESGTFKSAAVAARVAAAGPQQVSIGFLHPTNEPSADKIFRNIVIFERSLVPPGRAANSMTRLTTKERSMDEEKRKAARLLLGDDLLNDLLSNATASDKALQDQAVAYKDDRITALEAQIADLRALITAEKAVEAKQMMPMSDDAEAEDMAEEEDDGSIFSEDEMEAIASKIAEKMTAAYSSKMDAAMTEMKSLMGAFSRKDDTEARIVAIDTRLKDLEGDQPRASLYRASQAANTTLTATDAAALKQAADPASGDPLAAFLAGFTTLNGGEQ